MKHEVKATAMEPRRMANDIKEHKGFYFAKD